MQNLPDLYAVHANEAGGFSTMKQSVKVLCAILVVGLQSAWASPEDTLASRIEDAVPKDFSGQIVVSDLEQILYSGCFGYADREADIPVNEKTLFDIGSITKTYTATAVLLLASQEKLGLDMTLSAWFPGLPDRTGSIALHQLLSHTSGLPLYSGDDDDPCDRECFDQWLAEVSLEFSPGEQYSYSNPGYSALARIVEKVSGDDYETFINTVLAEPLAAGPIGYLQHGDDATYAVGYLGNERIGLPTELGWMEDGPSWHLRGNGGLLTTATALQRWMKATANGQILPETWRASQLERHAERGDGVWYGYGWSILDKPWGEVIDHTGGNGFFFADARWIRDRDLILTITNNAFEREQIQALLNDLRAILELTEQPGASSAL
jgi:CubicO group peptidase (beta-lactamase class C family)